MFSLFLVVIGIIAAIADRRSFTPQKPVDPHYNHHRVWVHLNPKCFSSESSVRTFKDYLVSKYSCIAFNEERRKIYKHPVTANYSVWSLWLEKRLNNNLDCLNTVIDLPQNVILHCIDNVYYEPLQHLDQAYVCVDQGIPSGSNDARWSLDIADGLWNNIYKYPSFDTDANNVVEAIILDTDVDNVHVEFAGLATENLFTGDYDPGVSQNHGTHVSGTVLGDTVGISRGSKLNYYATCQAGSSCAWSDIEDGYETAINYMIEKRAANPGLNLRFVINYSVGGARTTSNEASYNGWGQRITANGGIWVTSAGNNDQLACNYAPSFTDWALTIAAYDSNSQAASFTNYGECIDTWGPGVNVYSSTPGDGYGFSSGTSMSSPKIAGMVMNLLKMNNGLTLEQLKAYINNADNYRSVNGPKGTMNQVFVQCID